MTDTIPGQTALCDPGPRRTPPTPAQARAERIRRCLALGFHPAGIPTGRPLRLHPDAAPPDDRTADGARCGTCTNRHQQRVSYTGVRPKCHQAAPPRRDPAAAYEPGRHGPDIPAWWPACTAYLPAPPSSSSSRGR